MQAEASSADHVKRLDHRGTGHPADRDRWRSPSKHTGHVGLKRLMGVFGRASVKGVSHAGTAGSTSQEWPSCSQKDKKKGGANRVRDL